MSIQRNAQAFYLSSSLHTTNTKPFTISATAALDLLLDGLYINYPLESADGAGLVTAITLSGQSLMASTEGAPISMFIPSNNYAIEGINSLGLTIATNQVFSLTIDHTFATILAADNPCGFSISTEPTAVTIPPNESGSLLSYIFGMGVVNIAAAGQATLQATCLRDDVFLGRLVMDTDAAKSNTMQIISFKVDGIELLSSVTPADTPLLLGQLKPDSNDKTGLQANYVVRQNSIVQITVKNVGGAPQNVAAGFYCKSL